ncbi:hypothetical protein HDZ31DRAFT_43858 [Schizophyllum fasciatum]
MYDATQWLVDRANIHDVVLGMLLYADTKQTERLGTDIFADEIFVDYTSMLGGEPYKISGQEQAKVWKDMQANFDAIQHTTFSPLIDLGQPSGDRDQPSTASVLVNTGATLVRKAAEGGPIMQSGGRYELGLTRTSSSGNPWRISKLKMVHVWLNGNPGVLPKQA